MKCPIDQTELVMTDRQGVEIDYCPKCRGIWLDRGELDKIIERTTSVQTAPMQPVNQPLDNVAPPRDTYPPQYEQPRREYRRGDDNGYGHDNRKHKKEGFLGDLFDF